VVSSYRHQTAVGFFLPRSRHGIHRHGRSPLHAGCRL